MTDQLLARPVRPANRKKRWWIAAAVVVPVMLIGGAGAVAFQILKTPGPLPAGPHTVAVYTLDDAVTVPATGGRPLLGMCDADSYYLKTGDTALCAPLNGSLGEVRATGTDTGVVLDARAAATARELALKSDDKATRVLLQYDGDPVALVTVAALAAGGPVTAAPVN
jgi:hypothetical protein